NMKRRERLLLCEPIIVLSQPLQKPLSASARGRRLRGIQGVVAVRACATDINQTQNGDLLLVVSFELPVDSPHFLFECIHDGRVFSEDIARHLFQSGETLPQTLTPPPLVERVLDVL